MASNTVLFRSIWVSNQILVKLSSQNGGNKSFVCWRCTDWQGMCFPTKNNNIVIFQSLFSNKTKVFSWNKDTGLSIFWFEGNLCQNQWAQPWVKHGGGSGRNDALREYYIQLCNKWTPRIVFLAKITVLAIFLSSDFRPLSVGGYPPFYVKKCPLLFWENIVRGISVTFSLITSLSLTRATHISGLSFCSFVGLVQSSLPAIYCLFEKKLIYGSHL